MSLFRRHPRPQFRGDFPADDRDITEATRRPLAEIEADIKALPHHLPPSVFRRRLDKLNKEWIAENARLFDDGVAALEPWDGTTVPLSALRGYPHYAPPAAVLRMPQARAVMTVYPPGPGMPAPTPQALEVVRYLRDRVTILRRRGQLDRISDEKLAMLPAMSRRSTARVIVDEAAELLRCGGEQR